MPLFVLHTGAADSSYDPYMATLLGYVDTMVPKGQRRVIVGDFNAWDNLTDPHLCLASSLPGEGHEAGIRRIKNAGYTSMFRVRNPSGNAYTGMVNVQAYSRYATSCIPTAGLPQGHPYKAIDYAFSKHIAGSDILAATKFGVPIGGFGNCAASDHLGLKVTVRTR
jgi:endonuclease/exonuclease/phosphatase family metal-dependent hydrolase